ncbi:Lysophospholipase L1 [Desulfocicer vacuolatum DSM 3385]|uniref:Lysophospholipase L1 n=1 Tax=Desulfocicer vacuolatum DSM 3385 TaxID=1121400 RepID=A0A1W2BU14_9BACT|nr:SGNH/GDSL hydrolase family protein [Desulfocicer vacuolatum]SMC76453.1 Lysophospholipase L1 [Desulfocicer vacuolatum DSM 3385]
MKKIVYIFCVNAAVLLLMLLAVEMGARLLVPRKNVQPIFNDETLRTRGRPFVVPDKVRGFALKPGYTGPLYHINQHGFRGQEFPGTLDKKIQIVTLGESTTFGWGVGEYETFPYFLMQAFGPGENVQVINGGVPSYTSSQTLAYLQEIVTGDVINAQWILINILWNDIWYSTIGNWHPDILVYQKPPGWMSWIVDHSCLARILIMGAGSKEKAVDRFNPAALDQYEKNIEQMILLCQRNKIPLAFVSPPFDADHMPESGLNEFHVRYSRSFFIATAHRYLKALTHVASRHGIPVFSHGVDIRYLHQKSLFLDALHPTSQGNKIMARDVYGQLLPLLHETQSKGGTLP